MKESRALSVVVAYFVECELHPFDVREIAIMNDAIKDAAVGGRQSNLVIVVALPYFGSEAALFGRGGHPCRLFVFHALFKNKEISYVCKKRVYILFTGGKKDDHP